MIKYAALATLLLTTAAHGGETLSGHADLYFGRAWMGEESATIWSAGGVGRVNVTFDQRWNGEGEIFADRLFNDEGNITSFGGAAHLYWRDPASFAAGAFASVNGLWGNGEHFATHWRVGPQAQFYTDRATFYGQAWYGQEHGVGIPDPMTEWGARAIVRTFVTDNLRLDAELTYVDINDSFVDAAGVIGAVQVNYRFTNQPWTLFARYQIDHPLEDATFVGDLHRVHLGARWSFGGSTLKDDDRNGATMEAPTRIIHFFARS